MGARSRSEIRLPSAVRSSWSSWKSHLVACAIGVAIGSMSTNMSSFWVNRLDSDDESRSEYKPSSSSSARQVNLTVSNDNGCDDSKKSSTSSKGVTQQQQYYDLLPVLVQDVAIGVTDMRMIVTEALVRVNFQGDDDNKAPVTVGPLHIFYPSVKPDVGTFFREVLHDLMNEKNNGVFGGSVRLESVDGADDRRAILYAPQFWKRVASLADKAFFTDMSAALCSNPTRPITSFSRDYDWIGSAFFWAADPTSKWHRGGNGAVSIRSPKHMYAILKNASKEEIEHAGNEDMWYVERLGAWERANISMFGVPPPKLPSFEEQTKFGVEVVPSPEGVTPAAIYHLMIIMEYSDRERMIALCPEAKRMFAALHEPTCTLMDCPRNMSYNLYEWEERKKEEDFDKCTDICTIVYHPVASQFSNSSSMVG